MKLKRHLRSLFFGALFGFTYAVLVNGNMHSQAFWSIVGIAFIGVLLPNLDRNFMTRFSKKNWWVNLFLIPFLLMLLIPAYYVSAFFVGYYGHVVNDLDKRNNLKFAEQRAFTGLLWILSLMIIMAVFNLNFYQTMQLFQ